MSGYYDRLEMTVVVDSLVQFFVGFGTMFLTVVAAFWFTKGLFLFYR